MFILIFDDGPLRFWESIWTNAAALLGPPSGKSGKQEKFSIFPLLLSFSLVLFLLSYPCSTIPKHPPTHTHTHFHFNIFLHFIPGCLGFKEMLCVQSKQKEVEYQQSVIKQLMDLYSLEEPILGCKNPTLRTQTYRDVPPLQGGTGKDIE